MKSREYERSIYELMIEMKELVMKHSTITNPVERQKSLQRLIHSHREDLHRINSRRVDPLEKPLTEEFRVRYDEDGEGSIEYGILPEDGTETTDEEIREYIRDYVELPEINSPYDCTGKRFTRWVDYKRTPAGIVIIHAIGLDV